MTRRQYDSNGFYEVQGNPIARSGILEYLGSQISPELVPDRIYKVCRPPSELNNPETLASFRLVPWFNRHEMVGDGFSAPESVGVQGITGESVYYDETDSMLKSNIKAYGSSLIKMIDDGIKELSIGMTCDWIIKGGVTPDGEAYDVIQTNIRGNHLASVESGRAGAGVAVMDSSVNVINFAMDESNLKPTETRGNVMDLQELMAKVKELQPAKEELAKLHAEIGAMLGDQPAEPEMDTDKEKLDVDVVAEDEDDDAEKAPTSAMDAAIAKLTKRVKELEGSAMDEAAMMKRIEQKNALVAKVTPIVGEFDSTGMTSAQVAKYALDHKAIGIACDSGAEVATLNGYLAARKQPTFVRDGAAQDSADVKPKSLEEMGL